MTRHHSGFARLACSVAIGWLLLAVVGGCTMSPPIQVTVTVAADGMPVATPDVTSAHEQDKVHWVFQGPAAREFAVKFTSAADSPFDWSEQKGTQLWGTVKPGAAKDGRRTEYKYKVDVDGKVLDPKIIIEPKSL